MATSEIGHKSFLPPAFAQHPKACITFGALITSMLLMGGIIAAYFLVPNVHAWTHSHLFTPLNTQHLPLYKGLLMVSLPIVVTTALGVFALYKDNRRKQKKHNTNHIEPNQIWHEPKNPSKRSESIIACVAIGALLSVGVCLAYLCVPAIQQGIDSAMNHQLSLGQHLLYNGGPALAVSGIALTGMGIWRQHQAHKRQQEQNLIIS